MLSSVLSPHMILPSSRGKKGVLLSIVSTPPTIILWEDPATGSCKVRTIEGWHARLVERKGKRMKVQSCEGRAAGCEKRANGSGKDAAEQPGANEDTDRRWMTIRQVEHAALNGTAEKLSDVSLPITCKLDCSDYTWFMDQSTNQICKSLCKQFKV